MALLPQPMYGLPPPPNVDTTKEKTQRACIICYEEQSCNTSLIKPCRNCDADYCTDCLESMFSLATTDSTRMPPRCCTLIQIHTISKYLTDDEAKEYRARFEEWISPVKTYCPAPTCSAFIPEKRLPSTSTATSTPPTLQKILNEVLIKVSSTETARFFRGELDITELPGFTAVVKHHIDLTMMQDNVGKYRSTNELTVDMRLLVSNAKHYNGDQHPVSLAADELFGRYLLEISDVTDRLLAASNTLGRPSIFACHKCHIAICSDCKQIEHTDQPCDVTAKDHEAAMLAAFGYKRCPRCGAGVKRMFGCSHMQCVCGAHWCYWCQRSSEECHGSCGAPEDDEEEDEEDIDSEEDESDDDEDMEPRQAPPVWVTAAAANATAIPATPTPNLLPLDVPPAPARAEHVMDERSTPTFAEDYRVVNLDAGGFRRWGETDYDFGSEPDDEPYAQVWSCHHSFKPYETSPNDGFNRGDLDRMECNRCFNNVQPHKPLPAQQWEVVERKRAKGEARRKKAAPKTQQLSESNALNEDTALECAKCRLVVCSKCRDKYVAEDKANGERQ